MKKIIPFAIGGAALIFYYFYSKSSAAKKLKVYFKTLKTKKVKGQLLPDFYAVFMVVNGSNTSFNIRSITGDLFINDQSLASIQSLEGYKIPGNSSTLIDIRLVTPVFNIASIVASLIFKKQKFTVNFDGIVNAEGFQIPITQKVSLN